ncbi:hypothetical protein M2351_003706 [Azospirillum canadense]|nr:hypothetical protein [Azospirillum canadense]
MALTVLPCHSLALLIDVRSAGLTVGLPGWPSPARVR